MKKIAVIFAAIIAAFSCASFAHAQTAQPVAGYDYGAARYRPFKVDSSGNLSIIGSGSGGIVYGPSANGVAPSQAPVLMSGWDGTLTRTIKTDATGILSVNVNGTVTVAGTATVSQATAANLNAAVVGNVAAGATDSGNGVKAAGVYNTSLPTYTTGQRSDLQTDSRGGLYVVIKDAFGGTALSVQSPADGATTQPGLSSYAQSGAFNGTTWDRVRSIDGASASTGVLATTDAPSSSANASITPSATSALASSAVIKASAGNLYRVRVTSTTAGYLLLANATSAQGNGAITPQSCTQIGVGTSEVDWSTTPARFTTGIVALISSTGCFTYTAQTTAMIEGFAK